MNHVIPTQEMIDRFLDEYSKNLSIKQQGAPILVPEHGTREDLVFPVLGHREPVFLIAPRNRTLYDSIYGMKMPNPPIVMDTDGGLGISFDFAQPRFFYPEENLIKFKKRARWRIKTKIKNGFSNNKRR